MGVIQNQTLRGSLYSYIGVLIGFVITGLLLPEYLSTAENGVIKLLLSYSIIFSQFAALGFNSITTRLFTYFRDKDKGHNGFLFIGSIVTLAGIGLSIMVFYFLKDILISRGGNSNDLFSYYANFVIPLIVCQTIFNFLDNYAKVLFESVIGTFLKELVQRLIILGVLFLLIFNIIDFEQFVLLYVIAIALPTVLLFIYLGQKKQLHFKPISGFISKDLSRSMFSVGSFGLIIGFSNMAILNIDSIMVSQLVGLSETGIYGITFFFGTLIIIPSRALRKISSAVYADSWKSMDMQNIKDVYQKSALNQFVFGLLLFVGIWGNIDNVFEILPKEYEAGKYVIFFIGLVNLIDMLSGNTVVIINTSPKYRYLSWILLIHLGIVVISNFLFIPIWGLTGAAIASFVSTCIYALIRFMVLYRFYKLQPYNWKFILPVLIAVLSYALSTILPDVGYLILDIILRSTIILIIYIPLVYILKLSPELIAAIEGFIPFLKARK
ncbi:MAG: polysaccharide biosynthesis protein [Bacteroidetes bacterium]|nr:polysaccharide biosynthesis protein [Bacteroidota bacterium]